MEVVFLIGSVRFKDTFFEVEKKLTMKERKCVLLPYLDGFFNKEGYTEDEWEFLMEPGLKKIDMADTVFVVNVDGYIGTHTAREIEYARSKGKKIEYLYRE
ncbi:MAG: hypothetical protein ACFFCS_24105 [Candidatus Hodarchaeota archaeon]